MGLSVAIIRGNITFIWHPDPKEQKDNASHKRQDYLRRLSTEWALIKRKCLNFGPFQSAWVVMLQFDSTAVRM